MKYLATLLQDTRRAVLTKLTEGGDRRLLSPVSRQNRSARTDRRGLCQFCQGAVADGTGEQRRAQGVLAEVSVGGHRGVLRPAA
jgi:hypothetical protein